MVDILTPENDKKRLVVLVIILVVVAVCAMFYTTVVLKKSEPYQNEVPVTSREMPTRNTAQVSNINVPESTLPQPPAPPTAEDLKRMSDDVTKKGTPVTVPSKTVTQ